MCDSDSSKVCKAECEPEEDLDSLLDSALKDFDKPLPKVTLPSASAAATTTKPGDKNKSCSDASPAEESGEWNKEFLQFQDAMQAFLTADPNFQEELNKIANSSATAASTSTASSDFTASLEETMKAIAESTHSIPEPSPELAQLFNNMGLSGGMGGMGPGEGALTDSDDQMPEIMPFIQNFMQTILSKDLLYPALKDILNKYPDWLAEKRATLDEQSFEKYSHQYELMKQLCEEFETSDDASEEGKASSFQKVLSLLQKMQEYGNPPKELIGDAGTGFPTDEHGNLKLPGMPEQCALM